MRTIITLALAATLAACSGNPADTAAQKVTQEHPLITSLEFLSPAPHVYVDKPDSLTNDQTDDTLYNAPLAAALVKGGYARPLFKGHCYDGGHCDSNFQRVFGLTSKGKSAGWKCVPAGDSDNGTTCDIPIGTLQPGAAKLGDSEVDFDATPTPNEIGKLMTGNLIRTNWNDNCRGLAFGTKTECKWDLGPDGAPRQ